jgi:hypothetical protein
MAGHDMRSGFVLPGGTATEQLDLAILAEQAGWAGIFVREAVSSAFAQVRNFESRAWSRIW